MSTPFRTLISAAQLQALQVSQADRVVFDCSFDLGQSQLGRTQFMQSHIVGAQFVDLDVDLCAKGEGQARESAGRHPLPTREAFAAWLGSKGVGPQTQIVVYDRNGQMYCGRLWWMCQWVGHADCAVLDGGLAAWQAVGGAVAAGEGAPPVSKTNPLRPSLASTRSTAQLYTALQSGGQTIVDARATPRFRGEVEPLDPVAGHIPGALNRPFSLNFEANGQFKSAQQLREEFEILLAGRSPDTVVHHCGSGVTATPNVLAMVIAGYPIPALYPGSWSEWCNTPGMPVATGG